MYSSLAMPFPFARTYSPFDSDLGKEEQEGFLQPSLSQDEGEHFQVLGAAQSLQQKIWIFTPWVSTAIFAITTLLLFLRKDSCSTPFGSYEVSFDTDMISTHQIPLEQVRFRGSPKFRADSPLAYWDPVNRSAPWPENRQFVGKPNPQIDANWDELVGQRYFSISEEEATRAWGDHRHEFVDHEQGGYTASLEVTHGLHCLNMLRKFLYPGYYPLTEYQAIGDYGHEDHCVNNLRQIIQCYGSTTLVPTRYSPGPNVNYVDGDQVHTCRSFDFIHEFLTTRDDGGENYVVRDRSLIHKGQVPRG